MRKASRDMDAAFALEVLEKAPYITVSFTRPDGTPYGVPLSLARIDEKTFYFHCAMEGEKLDCIATNPMVALSAVTRCTPTVGPKDGSFTLQYKSAMAIGKAEMVTDKDEKIEALRAICLRFLPKHMDAFDDAIARSLKQTTVVKITLTAPPTGKRKQYDKHGEELKYGRME
jgi:nitroimidazol reductase NimA-like FMN-containing flavoprotein (pyridoxamine 5'-phosphate oxidase superfamily)